MHTDSTHAASAFAAASTRTADGKSCGQRPHRPSILKGWRCGGAAGRGGPLKGRSAPLQVNLGAPSAGSAGDGFHRLSLGRFHLLLVSTLCFKRAGQAPNQGSSSHDKQQLEDNSCEWGHVRTLDAPSVKSNALSPQRSRGRRGTARSAARPALTLYMWQQCSGGLTHV